MKRYKKAALAVVCILAVLGSLRLAAARLPVKLDSPEWQDVIECAEHQKNLYQSVEWYVKENGELPDADFEVRGWPARDTWKCPAWGSGYVLHPENFGDGDAVVIADTRDTHPATFMWWFRGLHPRVQTMGDGTVQLFEGGKVLTMVGANRETVARRSDAASGPQATDDDSG